MFASIDLKIWILTLLFMLRFIRKLTSYVDIPPGKKFLITFNGGLLHVRSELPNFAFYPYSYTEISENGISNSDLYSAGGCLQTPVNSMNKASLMDE